MPKRAMHPLVKHGGSVAVVIPRYLLYDLGWCCGDVVVEELLEDNTIRIRLCEDRAFRQKPIPRLTDPASAPGQS